MRSLRTVFTLAHLACVPALVAAQTPAPSTPQAPPAITMPARPAPMPAPAAFEPSEDLLNRLSNPPIRENSGSLFENVVKVLSERYYDEAFRSEQLPAIVDRYRARAAAAETLAEQRQVVHDLLSNIPASHLGLLSARTHRSLLADLLRYPYPSFGFSLVQHENGYYAGMLFENGPAVRAGLLAGDRIVTVDGVDIARSPRLDWRSDDAYIGDALDPGIHGLTAEDGDRIELRVERRPGEFVDISVPAERYTAYDAARASVRVIRTPDARIGYVHFWFVHLSGVPDLLETALAGVLSGADALVIDLRGRGGSATEVPRILAIVRGYLEDTGKPVFALVDRQTRSAKDVLAYEFKKLGVTLIGEPTAGAVIPAMFADVGHDSVLMLPTFRLPTYSDVLELKPVDPHIEVERPGRFAAGRDPILEAAVAEAARRVVSARQRD